MINATFVLRSIEQRLTDVVSTEEVKKAKRDLIKRCIGYQEYLIKRVADGSLDLVSHSFLLSPPSTD